MFIALYSTIVLLLSKNINVTCTFMFLDKRRTIRWWNKVFFTLRFFTLCSTFCLFCTNKVTTIRKNWFDTILRFNFLLRVLFGITNKPESDLEERLLIFSRDLLNPETHMKQTKLPKGKKNCVICTNLKQNKWVEYMHHVCD